MVKCGGERGERSILFTRYLVQSNAEVKQWDDINFSGFLNREVSENKFYVGRCFNNPRRSGILLEESEMSRGPGGGRLMAHAKVFGKLPVALVQSTGNNCISLILWKTKGIALTHRDQLRVRRARAFNFGAFGPEGVNANSLLIGVHTRKDFDIIWIKHVAGGH
jgi:hypothetical protein